MFLFLEKKKIKGKEIRKEQWDLRESNSDEKRRKEEEYLKLKMIRQMLQSLNVRSCRFRCSQVTSINEVTKKRFCDKKKCKKLKWHGFQRCYVCVLINKEMQHSETPKETNQVRKWCHFSSLIAVFFSLSMYLFLSVVV